MSTPSKVQCYTEERLRRFLDERLDAHDESQVAEHIGQCDTCRARMESLTGAPSAWHDVREHLQAATSADTFGGFEPDSAESRERDLRKLREYLDPTDDPAMLGRVGRYEVCGLVGRGSTGIVMKAFESQLNRYVAIKMLSPSFAGNGPARVRFEREAKAIAAVSHEHVVPVHAVDEHRGLPYLVMQYAAGGSLQQRINQRGPLDTCEVVRIGMQVARGLAEAHKQGIVHRDVKPANVMLEDQVERAMVTDFGLARVADEAAMTRSGVIAGTPQYMSPEQAKGEPVDPRSDLFSLGSTLYAACTGHSPFRAESVFGVIKRVCDSEPRPIREANPEIAPWLAAFVARLQQKDRDARFASADQVAEILGAELAHLQNPTAVAAPSRGWAELPPRAGGTWRRWSAALLTAAAVALLAWGLAERRADGGGAPPGSHATAGLLGAVPAMVAANEIFEQHSQHTFPIGEGGKLTLAAGFADVTVRAGNVDQVQLELTNKVLATDETQAAAFAKGHRLVVLAQRDDSVEMRCEVDPGFARAHPSNPIRAAAVRLLVPAAFDLDLTTTTGTIRVGNLRGDVQVVSASGAIELGRIRGDVAARSDSADIRGEIGPGTLQAISDRGNVYAAVYAGGCGDCTLRSNRGHVGLGLDKNDALTVDAVASSGEIRDPWGGQHAGGRWTHELNGGGSTIRTHSESGSVDVSWLDGSRAAGAAANDAPGQPGEFVTVTGRYTGGIVDGYVLYLPRSYDRMAADQYPVLLFLGGGCAVGGDVSDACSTALANTMRKAIAKVQDLAKVVEGGRVPLSETYRLLLDTFIVVMPHMLDGGFEERQFFAQEAAIEEILDQVATDYRVDGKRVYVTGAGRGGHGAWGLASRIPHRFAAAVPIRGMNFGITSYEALLRMPLWVGHNTKDKEVAFQESAAVVDKLESMGEETFYRIGQEDAAGTDYLLHDKVFTTYEDNDWPDLYGSPALYRWLLKHAQQ
ncbi:MAG: protein kinase [Planctomycetota bacterium]